MKNSVLTNFSDFAKNGKKHMFSLRRCTKKALCTGEPERAKMAAEGGLFSEYYLKDNRQYPLSALSFCEIAQTKPDVKEKWGVSTWSGCIELCC